MEKFNKDFIQNDYANNKNLEFFFQNFYAERTIIFENIYKIFEDTINNEKEKEDKAIQDIINQKDIKNNEKIQKIKALKCEKYSKNLKKNYSPEGLKKYNLGLIRGPYSISVQLVYYLKQDEEDGNNYENNNDNFCKNDEKSNTENDEEKEKFIILFDIDILTKIKINDDEEWICNSDYALYLIYIIKNLKNPHPTNSDEEISDESSYSLNDKYDMEHLFFISNNKKNMKKKVIEVEADLNISDIYKDIINKGSSDFAGNFIKYSLPGININDITINKYLNNEIYNYFKELNNFIFIFRLRSIKKY